METAKKTEISDYIRRSIPDIARKCRVKHDEVVKVMKELFDQP